MVPSVAAELDVDKNGFTASEVTAQSHKKVCGGMQSVVAGGRL